MSKNIEVHFILTGKSAYNYEKLIERTGMNKPNEVQEQAINAYSWIVNQYFRGVKFFEQEPG